MRTKMNQLKKQLKNERGLTLVELLAVIVILTIIAVIAFVMIGNVMENSRKDAHIENARQLIASAKMYETTVESIEGGSVDESKLIEEDLIEPLMDPWGKKSYSNAEVSKNDGKYSVTLEVDGDEKCKIDGVSEETLKEGDRDKICGQ